MAEPLDLSQPLPDRAHEGFRLAVLQMFEDIGWNTADVDLSLDMSDTLFQLLTTVQGDLAAARADLLALQEWRDTLTAEPAPEAPPTDPDDL